MYTLPLGIDFIYVKSNIMKLKHSQGCFNLLSNFYFMGLIQYIKDTITEMKHVSWPTQKQTTIFTALVIVISLLTAVYLGAFDFVFSKILEMAV